MNRDFLICNVLNGDRPPQGDPVKIIRKATLTLWTIFSLTYLLWLGAPVVVGATFLSQARIENGFCRCPGMSLSTCCCVSEPVPDAQPRPVPALPVWGNADRLFGAPLLPCLFIPAQPSFLSRRPPFHLPDRTGAASIFVRDCAYLI